MAAKLLLGSAGDGVSGLTVKQLISESEYRALQKLLDAYGVGIQVLKDLGLRRVRLLTNNPKKTDAFIYDGYDLEVVDQVPIVGPIHEHNRRYLATKRDKLGHRLP
jgi:GTP cyclohydrolase II